MVFSVSKNLEVSRCRKSENCWLQWQCTLIEILPLLTLGLQIGWSSRVPIVPDVPNELSQWIGTVFYLSAALSTGVFCYLAEKFGRTKIICFLSIPQMISWLMLLSNDIIFLLISRVVSGLAAGGVLSIVPIYLNEITNKSRRGLIVTFGLLVFGFGYFAIHLLVQYFCVQSVLYGVIVVPILHLLLSCFAVESPSYLVKKGLVKNASENLSKLRSLPSDDERVTKEIDRLRVESEDGKITQGYYIISLMRNQVNRNGLKIGLVLQTVRTLGGSYLITEQSWKVFLRSEVVLHDDVQKLAVPGILVVSALISVLLVEKCGRKVLLTTSTGLTAFSLGVLGVFMQTELTITSLNWLPLTALVFTTIGYGLGLFAVPYAIAVEVLNLEVRSTITGISLTYAWILMYIQVYIFTDIESYIGMDAIIYIYAAINIYGAIYALFAIPETTNKSYAYTARELRKTPLLEF